MKVKYEDRLKQKIIAITPDTLVVGVDIAKNYQWARFVDFRGIEHDHALKFKNRKGGKHISGRFAACDGPPLTHGISFCSKRNL